MNDLGHRSPHGKYTDGIDGNVDENTGADSTGAYNIRADMEESIISINDPNVEYLKVSITTGSSSSSFTFSDLSLLAYYHPRDVYPASVLANYFKTSIPD